MAKRFAFLLVAVHALFVAWPVHGQDEQAVQSLAQAVFEAPGHAAEPVTLPDTWAMRGVGARTAGRYRIRFQLAQAPATPRALMFTHLSSQHRVHVNGVLVSDEGPGPSGASRGIPMLALIHVPAPLLKAGENTLEIEVRHTLVRAGLSQVLLGPVPRLRERFERHELRHVALPQALNMATAGLALLMVLIWWRRRSEVALGSFGAFALVGSLRNHYSFFPVTVGNALLSDGALYAAQTLLLPLGALFAQAWSGRHWPRYTRIVMAATLVALGVALGVVPLGYGPELRRYIYPPLIALALPSLWMCVQAARRQGGWERFGQAVAMALLVGAILHDYLLQAGSLPITGDFAMPFAMPLVLGGIALALVRRMVRIMGEVQALNAELEERVAHRTQELAQANAAKTRFLASASHDLRQPLVTVNMLVDLAKECDDPPAVRNLLDRAGDAVRTMERQLAGLLDLWRFESRADKPVRSAVRVADLFAAIEQHEQAAAILKGLVLRLRASDAVVESDPIMIERIVRNFVSNAIRYTEHGGVLVAARRRGAAVRIEVYDTGIGIAEANRQAIFHEFVQLGDMPRDSARGLGLGLAIVSRLAALLGHPIGMRSQPGRGSCFWIQVPVVGTPSPASAGEGRGEGKAVPLPLMRERE